MSDEFSSGAASDWRQAFLQRHELPDAYQDNAQQWFDPILGELSARHFGASGPLFVGLNGSQGSGKSTLADYLVCGLREESGLSAIELSLDDFYLTRTERAHLAETVHPLLASRGVPGTHDLKLLLSTLEGLASTTAMPLAIPRFDKARDDRQPSDQWQIVESPPDIVILEGWCLGAQAQGQERLAKPCNDLEAREDEDGRWRHYVNQACAELQPVHHFINYWLMLKAPSFDCVLTWRRQQEQQLARQRPGAEGLMDKARLQRFVQHFQRITQDCLRDMPQQVDYLLALDDQRRVLTCTRPGAGM